MIVGIGLDIIELKRIEQVMMNQSKFVDRILTPSEKAQYDQLSWKRQVEFVAGRFAAKEAYAKANGTGIGQLSWQHIEIKSDHGRPYILSEIDDEKVHLTITHTKQIAAAQVIIERLSS